MPPTATSPGAPEPAGWPPSGGSARGRRRREQLVEAGLALLHEAGWASLTTRAIAERSGANAGLVHYYWDGLSGLKAEVARAAVARAFEPAVDLLTSSPSWQEGMAAVVRAGGHLRPEDTRSGAELMAAALHEPAVAEVVREALTDTRARLSGWLTSAGVEDPLGTATLVVAALDGLLLHRLVDPDLPLSEAADAVSSWGDVAPAPGATHVHPGRVRPHGEVT